ncbi:MAG: SRPBCC family protein [Chloroflexota bacterium]
MTHGNLQAFDPTRDLLLERQFDAPPEVVWRACTEPDRVKQWIAPAPWVTVECEIDLRPGGMFRFLMKSPDGSEESANLTCYLEVVKEQTLVWTNALAPGYRPVGSIEHVPLITAIFSFEPSGTGTKYVARVVHKDEHDRKQHEEMGFYEGWGTCLDQLVAVTKTM